MCYTVMEFLCEKHRVRSMSKRNHTLPVVQDKTLIDHREGREYRLSVGTAAWYRWLSTARHFAFRSAPGSFTARKEPASTQRGGWSWHAYRKYAGKLHQVSLGTSEELTLERLNAMAVILSGQNADERDARKRDRRGLQTQLQEARNQEQFPHAAPAASWSPVERGDDSESAARWRSPLPVPLTSLIGREREVAAACTLLAHPEVRLLTLTGTGGVGKTRLALQIASQVQADFPDGVCFVSLAPIRDADFVLPTLSKALGLPASSKYPSLDALQAALRERHLLLVLDNFEQVVSTAPELVNLLAACPRLKMLVTSRTVLHVRGEHEFPVIPLALPDPNHLPDSEIMARYGAVALFLERAQVVVPSFQLTNENAPLIAEICQRLDGLPLAIELAAARLTLLSLPALLERLEHRLQLLTGGPRDLPARQHTLRETVRWSYDLLSFQEQRLFWRLAVFVGGATLEAVEHLYRVLDGESAWVLDGMSSLLDKHLLSQVNQDTNIPRFQMLETLREYGLEVLTASGELEAVRLAHAQYYLALAEEAEAHRFGEEQERWSDQLEQEHDNLRATLHWSGERGEDGQRKDIAWRLIGALQEFWVVYGYTREGQHFVEQVLARDEGVPTSVRAKALNSAGWLALWRGEYARATALCEESLTLYRALHDPRGIALALYRLGRIALTCGNAPRAASLFKESQALSRDIGDKVLLAFALEGLALATFQFADQREHLQVRSLLEESLTLFQQERYQGGVAWALYGLGLWHFRLGEASTARSLFEESLALFRALRQRQYIAHPLYFLGKVAAQQGDLPAALTHYRESLALFQELDDHRSSAACLEEWGGVVAQQGAAIWAAQLWGAAEGLREASDLSNSFSLFTIPDARADEERMRTVVRAKLGEQAFAQALAEGRAMTPEQALAAQGHAVPPNHPLAKSLMSAPGDQQQTPSPSPPNDLSEREMEVLRLVAQGLSDAQVAEILVISPRTVNAHLRSIYSKLEITSRHAATLFALKHHLI